MSRRSVNTACIIVAALVLAGCSSGLTLTVDLRTDFVPLTEITGVKTMLDAVEIDHVPSAGEPWLSGARIAELSGVKAGAHDVVVSLYAGPRLVAERHVALMVTADYAVTVVITHSCAGVTCPRAGDPAGATTCVNGTCASPACGSTGEPTCPDCTSAAMCPAARASCAASTCVAGACLDQPHDDRCLPGQTCDLAAGCVMGAPDSDAGTPHDAGPLHDAGRRHDAGLPDGGTTTCSADCGGRECGPDPVCGESCGPDCTGGAACDGSGRCTCPGTDAYCSGTCVDLATSGSDCGACGTSCSGGACVGGACVCPPTLSACSTGCTDVQTDSGHCGSCTNACNIFTGPACCGGGCTSLNIDSSNCGSCGHACGGATPTCCAAGCTDTSTDHSNCGHCGGSCDTGQTCVAGICV